MTYSSIRANNYVIFAERLGGFPFLGLNVIAWGSSSMSQARKGLGSW